MDNRSFDPRALCCAAVECAKEFDKNLDFSDKSILELEEILEHYSNELKKSNTAVTDEGAEEKIMGTALMWGTYLGETLLRNHLAGLNYRWEMQDNGRLPKLFKDSSNAMYPVNKVYRRLVNGREDSAAAFYDIAVMVSQGKLMPPQM